MSDIVIICPKCYEKNICRVERTCFYQEYKFTIDKNGYPVKKISKSSYPDEHVKVEYECSDCEFTSDTIADFTRFVYLVNEND